MTATSIFVLPISLFLPPIMFCSQRGVRLPTGNMHKSVMCDCDILGSPEYTLLTKKVSKYDQEIPQSQTADNPVPPQGRPAQLSRDTRKTN